jgi:hypothetical protein
LNQLLQYEQLLAEKIQQSPVPDMADAIWANIELELDKDLPDDPGNEPPSSSPGGGGAPGTSFYFYIVTSVVITALVLTFVWMQGNNKPAQPSVVPPARETPTNRTPVIDSSSAPVVGNKRPIVPVISPRIDSGNTSTRGTIINSAFTDSLLNQPIGRIETDSVTIKDNAGLGAPVTLAIDSAMKQKETLLKKPKGVRGITDDDYKIRAEKKDSTRKG